MAKRTGLLKNAWKALKEARKHEDSFMTIERRVEALEAAQDAFASMFVSALIATGRSRESAVEFVAEIRRDCAALAASTPIGKEEITNE